MLRRIMEIGVVFALLTFSSSGLHAAKPGERIGNWFYNCGPGSKTQKRSCYISQTAEKVTGKLRARLLTVNVGNLFGDGGLWLVSLLPWQTWNVAVQKQLIVDVDGKRIFRGKVDTCFRSGCRAKFLLDRKDIRALKRGKVAGLSFKTIGRKNIRIEISLKGFSKALNALR